MSPEVASVVTAAVMASGQVLTAMVRRRPASPATKGDVARVQQSVWAANNQIRGLRSEFRQLSSTVGDHVTDYRAHRAGGTRG